MIFCANGLQTIVSIFGHCRIINCSSKFKPDKKVVFDNSDAVFITRFSTEGGTDNVSRASHDMISTLIKDISFEEAATEDVATEEAASGGFTLRVWSLLYPSKFRFVREAHLSKFNSTIVSFFGVPSGSSGNVSALNFEHPDKKIRTIPVKGFKKSVFSIGALVMMS